MSANWFARKTCRSHHSPRFSCSEQDLQAFLDDEQIQQNSIALGSDLRTLNTFTSFASRTCIANLDLNNVVQVEAKVPSLPRNLHPATACLDRTTCLHS